MSDEFQKEIDALDPLPELEPNEIRVCVNSGVVYDVFRGVKVPESIKITILDRDTDGNYPADNPELYRKDQSGDLVFFTKK